MSPWTQVRTCRRSQHAHLVNSVRTLGEQALNITYPRRKANGIHSNYWTAIVYFKAKNGTYKRVPQIPNSGFNGVNGGMTVYYMQDGLYNFQQTSKVTAFKPVRAHSYVSAYPDFLFFLYSFSYKDSNQSLGLPHVCRRC
jgi:hypothetical protein